MGAIGGMLGLSGGAAGTGFNEPRNAYIQNPVSTYDSNAANANSQAALGQQQNLLTALQGQGGIGNQSQVYGQLQNIAAGKGPNPAQAMLAQATGQNVANQAALMAGQRGAGANVGMMARQAAQQGAATQQQAAGQGATLQAQQSLNALTGAGNIANTQVGNQIGATQNYTSAQQQQQANLLNAIANQNNANVGMQSNINNNNASLANTMMGQQSQAIGGVMQGMSQMGGMMGGMSGAGGGEVGHFDEGGGVEVAPAPNIGNPPPPGAPPAKGGGSGGGGGGGMMSMLPMLAMLAAGGGDVQKMGFGGFPVASQGGSSDDPYLGADKSQTVQQGPQSNFGQFLHKVLGPKTAPQDGSSSEGQGQSGLFQGMSSAAGAVGQGIGSLFGAEGGKVPAVLSPGEKYLPPSAVSQVKQGANPMQVGETIPGKPVIGGAKNSYSNDTVPKTLEEGGIVVPRSATKSKDPSKSSAQFVAQTLAERKGK